MCTKILLCGFNDPIIIKLREQLGKDRRFSLVGGFDREPSRLSKECYVVNSLADLHSCYPNTGNMFPDVIIDYSSQELFYPVWEYAFVNRIPIITGTQDFSFTFQKQLNRSSEKIAILQFNSTLAFIDCALDASLLMSSKESGMYALSDLNF